MIKFSGKTTISVKEFIQLQIKQKEHTSLHADAPQLYQTCIAQAFPSQQMEPF